MPQIAQLAEIYSSQIFWMLVVFGLIYFVIAKSMLPKIEATMDGRDKRVREDLVAASRARSDADEAEAGYRARLAEARAAAQKAAAEAKSAAAAEAETRVKAADAVSATKLADAEARLAVQRNEALATIEGVAAEAAQDIVQRLSGVAVARDRADAAVKAALAQQG
ncbi:F0F1 ATP synthase subunit B family protein [Sphingomonas quercus]|uniref:ATP synthase subunit b n=1 Tax=Sphingomonas quercus TaxID=2842451 RepID=A0ABS6BE01_9SPHN|nr:ATPase [Sphingomonas quercus]MBU3076535.1 ATPase [Sphingomonas quercus]